MNRSKEVNKRKVSLIIHKPKPEPIIPAVFFLGNIDGIGDGRQ